MVHEDGSAEQLFVSKLDELTKQGQRLQVLKELTRVLKQNPSRSLRPHLARIANRNHAYILALRILHPLIREDREKTAEATSEALNIYATSLMWIGSLEESQQYLKRIKGLTDALLTEAFVFFAKWEYKKAIPVLMQYIQSTQITSYQKLVGRINLLAAHIAVGNLKHAKEVFDPLIIELRAHPSFKLLYGNCMELRAQIEILEQSYQRALEYLNESELSLAGQPGRYLLYVNKWRALTRLGISPQDEKALASLSQVKQEALKLRNWETIRDCDFHFARLTQDENLIKKILLGTPYQGYHKRVESLFNISVSNSRNLEYCPGEILLHPEKNGLNLNSISDHSFLSSTSWPLLQLMTKDIYRPPRMGLVFSGIYKSEYFDPFTSPQRVRNCVFRFNEWAQKTSCDFRIKIEDGDFLLSGPKGVSVVCTKRIRPMDSWQASLKVFSQQNDSRSFKASDLAGSLGITERSALVIIQKALKANRIQKLGRGKNSRYIFFSGRRAA